MSPVMPDIEVLGDRGEKFGLHDVVGGRWPQHVDVLVDMHCRAFPDHEFAAEVIRVDASTTPHREQLVAHQWLLTLDGEPVGYSLADSNLRRRVAPIHFLAVEPALRHMTVGGVRVGGWFLHDSLRQYAADAGDAGLGCVAETPEYKLPIFRQHGWRVLDAPYLEPVHGWNWRTDGLQTRSVRLIWLPPDGSDIDALEPSVAAAAAAAFLLDKYGLDQGIDWVARLVSEGACDA
ncbi:MAG: hypothetical protein KGR47_01485 [Acidobacteria bacterium]|nr:hypothetical protein [Acidobacteriota bacterium]